MNTNSMAWWFFIVAAVVVLLGCLPLALIWAVNTLFGLAIPVTFKTWMAALLLSAPFAYSGSRK